MGRNANIIGAELQLQEVLYQDLMGQARGFTRITLLVNKALSTLFFIPVFPIQLISTFLLGIIVSITFGLFGWILTIIWLVFLGTLLAFSWIWIKVPILSPIIVIPGLIWARISGIIATIFPSMGEWSSRKIKIDLCDI